MSQLPDHSDRLTAWVRDHGPAVLGYLFAMTGDRHRADDLVQDVFYRAWRARQRYTDRGRERAYLLQIAQRLARDAARRPRREITIAPEQWNHHEPVDAACESPPAQYIEDENRRRLADAMESLGEPQRQTLLLRYYTGLGFDEIARMTGSPLGTVLSHCRRGLMALRRLLVEQP